MKKLLLFTALLLSLALASTALPSAAPLRAPADEHPVNITGVDYHATGNPDEYFIVWGAAFGDGISDVTVYLYKDEVVDGNHVMSAPGANSFTITGLTPGASYTYYLKATGKWTDVDGTVYDVESAPYTISWTQPGGSSDPDPDPAVVHNISVNGGVPTAAGDAMNIGYNVFDQDVQSPASVTLYLYQNSVDTTPIATQTTNPGNFAITGLTPGTNYTYVIKAVATYADSNEEYVATQTFTFTTPGEAPAFTYPSLKWFGNLANFEGTGYLKPNKHVVDWSAEGGYDFTNHGNGVYTIVLEHGIKAAGFKIGEYGPDAGHTFHGFPNAITALDTRYTGTYYYNNNAGGDGVVNIDEMTDTPVLITLTTTPASFTEGGTATLEISYTSWLSLNPTAVTLKVSEAATITPTLKNSTEPIVWSTSNEAIAIVNNGVVTGISEGTATITATAGSVSASCEVTVNPFTFPSLFLFGNLTTADAYVKYQNGNGEDMAWLWDNGKGYYFDTDGNGTYTITLDHGVASTGFKISPWVPDWQPCFHAFGTIAAFDTEYTGYRHDNTTEHGDCNSLISIEGMGDFPVVVTISTTQASFLPGGTATIKVEKFVNPLTLTGNYFNGANVSVVNNTILATVEAAQISHAGTLGLTLGHEVDGAGSTSTPIVVTVANCDTTFPVAAENMRLDGNGNTIIDLSMPFGISSTGVEIAVDGNNVPVSVKLLGAAKAAEPTFRVWTQNVGFYLTDWGGTDGSCFVSPDGKTFTGEVTLYPNGDNNMMRIGTNTLARFLFKNLPTSVIGDAAFGAKDTPWADKGYEKNLAGAPDVKENYAMSVLTSSDLDAQTGWYEISLSAAQVLDHFYIENGIELTNNLFPVDMDGDVNLVGYSKAVYILNLDDEGHIASAVLRAIPYDAIPFEADKVTMSIAVWEGPITHVTPENSSAKAGNVLSFSLVDEDDDYFYFVAPLYDKSHPEQSDITTQGENPRYYSSFVTQCQFNSSAGAMYFDVRNMDAWSPIMKEDVRIGHSRMKYDIAPELAVIRAKKGENDRFKAFEIMFSSDNNYKKNATVIDQKGDYNRYQLVVDQGSQLYSLMGATATGDNVTLTLQKKISNPEYFQLNLGRDITLNNDQFFNFKITKAGTNEVDDSFNFTIGANDNENYRTSAGTGALSMIPAGTTFSRIVLKVDYTKAETDPERFTLFLLPSDKLMSFYPEPAHSLPYLKTWVSETNNNDSEHFIFPDGDLNAPKYDYIKFVDGATNFMEFCHVYADGTPVTEETRDNEFVHPNVFYLAMPKGGITLSKGMTPAYIDDNPQSISAEWLGHTGDPHLTYFNVTDEDGYDVGNPMQGGQWFYPNTWWCCNPRIVPDDYDTNADWDPDTRFKYGTPGDLVVGEQMTVYGITLFRIVGYRYDMYAPEGEEFQEGNIYYLFFDTNPPVDGKHRANMYAPVTLNMLSGGDANAGRLTTVDDSEWMYYLPFDHEYPVCTKEGTLIYEEDGTTPVKRYYNIPLFGTSNPGFTPENTLRNRPMLLKCTRINELGDALYKLDLSNYRPGVELPFEVVSITGSIYWNPTYADPKDDKLRPSKFSYYYIGQSQDNVKILNGFNELDGTQSDNIEGTLADVKHSGAVYITDVDNSYNRFYLATNPDNVRYMLQANIPGLEPVVKEEYIDHSKGRVHHAATEQYPHLIYPRVEVTVPTTVSTHELLIRPEAPAADDENAVATGKVTQKRPFYSNIAVYRGAEVTEGSDPGDLLNNPDMYHFCYRNLSVPVEWNSTAKVWEPVVDENGYGWAEADVAQVSIDYEYNNDRSTNKIKFWTKEEIVAHLTNAEGEELAAIVEAYGTVDAAVEALQNRIIPRVQFFNEDTQEWEAALKFHDGVLYANITEYDDQAFRHIYIPYHDETIDPEVFLNPGEIVLELQCNFNMDPENAQIRTSTVMSNNYTRNNNETVLHYNLANNAVTISAADNELKLNETANTPATLADGQPATETRSFTAALTFGSASEKNELPRKIRVYEYDATNANIASFLKADGTIDLDLVKAAIATEKGIAAADVDSDMLEAYLDNSEDILNVTHHGIEDENDETYIYSCNHGTSAVMTTVTEERGETTYKIESAKVGFIVAIDYEYAFPVSRALESYATGTEHNPFAAPRRAEGDAPAIDAKYFGTPDNTWQTRKVSAYGTDFAEYYNESEMSTTGITAVTAANLIVKSRPGHIITDGFDGIIGIYDVRGQLIHQGPVGTVAVPSGIYIVTCPAGTAKVLVP